MKVPQVSNSGVKNWKKRKFKTVESNVKATKVDKNFVNNPLNGNEDKRIRVNCVKPETEARGPDNATKKGFDSHNKKKLHNNSKTNGNVMNTANSKAADFKTPGSNVGSFHGTNGSGKVTKKQHIQSEKKSSNDTSERNILLTKIERKAVCSNWKLFKEVSNSGVKNWKKRKFKTVESNVKATKVDNNFVNNPLNGNEDKRIRVNCVKPETEARGPDNATKKGFDSHNKKKLHNNSKTNGNVMNTANSKAADFKTPGSNVGSFQGTNGSGKVTKKQHIQSEKKSSNDTSERNILLTKIERKAVCSNWKLFKEVVAKNESSTGRVPKFKRKKPFHARNAEIKTPTQICDTSTNSQKLLIPLQNVSNDKVNEHLSQKEKNFKKEHIHRKMIKSHSENLTNGKQNKSAEDKNAVKQGTSGAVLHNSKRLTKEIALDCEMVGTDDQSDMVARVSLVNKFGLCVYDKYVAPTEEVHDYRTWVSGIRPENLKNAEDFKQVQKEVAEILQGRLLVGHALRNDLKVLFLSHPRRYTRDTQRFKLFRELVKSKRPSLKKLAAAVLNVSIQEGEHSSVEDARVAMQLYMMYQKKWEKLLRNSRRKHTCKDVTVSTE